MEFILWTLPFTEGMRILDFHVWTGDGMRPGRALRWADDVLDLDELDTPAP